MSNGDMGSFEEKTARVWQLFAILTLSIADFLTPASPVA